MRSLMVRAALAGVLTGATLTIAALTLRTWQLEAQVRGCEAFAGRQFAPCTYDGKVLTCETANQIDELIGVIKRKEKP